MKDERLGIMNLATFGAFKLAQGGIKIDGEVLEKCKEVMLQIADDVVAVCDKYEIDYTLGGGSALGAIRHQGMIPWDDDIDINLFRKDYDRFIEAIEMEYGDRYWIHTPEKTKGYGLLFIQLRRKGTVMRSYEDRDMDECGIGIDIFPMENTYNQKIFRDMHGVLCMGTKFALSCRKIWRDRKRAFEVLKNNPAAKQAVMIKCVIGFCLSILSVDAWTHLTNKVCKMCHNDNSKWIVIPSGRKQFFGELYEREPFMKMKLVPFDGRKFKITGDAENYLTHLYGDYMRIPPVEERESHMVYELKLEM